MPRLPPPALSNLRSALPLLLLAAALVATLVVLVVAQAAGGGAPPALLAAAAALLTALGTAPMLWWRVVLPLELLDAHAEALAAEGPVPALEWEDGGELGRLAQHLDVLREHQLRLGAALERKSDQLDRLATHDVATGLANRTLLRELFPHQAAAARRARTPMALLLIDLDHFKTLNDTLGHGVGDEVLRVIGRRLAVALRESDFLCRFGGDEFAVLLPQTEGWDHVARVADRLLHAVAQPIVLDGDGQGTVLTASIGISMYPSDAGDFDAVVRTAEIAMYRAKELGRARHAFYLPQLDTALRERAAVERELLRAVTEHELVMYYQPIVDAASGRLIAAEALLRWQHPTRGLLEPGAFLDAAEHAGLMREVGRWTLETACRQLACWQQEGHAPSRVAINLSARQAIDTTLPEAVRTTLQRHGLQPAQLELEMTENALAGDSESATHAAARLRALGVALTIDDFGTGNASLTTLQRLRPDRLKIDRVFVHRIGLPEGDGGALATALVGMARALAIEVVAEGVETAPQREWLLLQGCGVQQGFLYGQPMPPSAFERLLLERHRGAETLSG